MGNDSTLTTLALSAIDLSRTPTQIARRERFDPDALEELAASIRARGVLQPVVVRKKGRRYELVAGERRVAAARLAGLENIAAVVRDLDDQAVIEVQLIENLQRTDVHPMEEAEGYEILITTHGQKPEDVAARLGKSTSYIYKRLKLTSLTPTVRRAFYKGEISVSQALIFARVPISKLQNQAYKRIIKEAYEPPSTQRTRDQVQSEYMLLLSSAPFKTSDETLPGGSCGVCPKRSGAQPEIFDDVKGDFCTDGLCWRRKVRSDGNRKIKAHADNGGKTITGKEAAKLFESRYFGAHSEQIGDRYVLTSGHYWINGKKRRVSKLAPKSQVPRILIQHPDSGRAYEVVPISAVDKARRALEKTTVPEWEKEQRAAKKKHERERRYRRALFRTVREKNDVPPTLTDLARLLFERAYHDTLREVALVRDCSVTDLRELDIESMSVAELESLLWDLVFSGELLIYQWQKNEPPQKLETLAKRLGIDLKALRKGGGK